VLVDPKPSSTRAFVLRSPKFPGVSSTFFGKIRPDHDRRQGHPPNRSDSLIQRRVVAGQSSPQQPEVIPVILSPASAARASSRVRAFFFFIFQCLNGPLSLFGKPRRRPALKFFVVEGPSSRRVFDVTICSRIEISKHRSMCLLSMLELFVATASLPSESFIPIDLAGESAP